MKISSVIEFIPNHELYKFYAKMYFMNLYGEDNIIYHKEEDYYTYRGCEFTYFKSGFSIDGDKSKDSYLLKSRNMPYTWLFTYGNLEDRWNDYIKKYNEEKSWYESNPKDLNIFRRFIKRLNKCR